MFAPYLFAQASTEVAGGTAPAGQKQQGGLDPFTVLIYFVLPFVLLWLIVLRPRNKQDQERKLALNKLQKNDEVVTIGGIMGTVVGIKEKSTDGTAGQDDEITLRVEGAKIRFIRSAIARIVSKGEESKDTDNGSKS